MRVVPLVLAAAVSTGSLLVGASAFAAADGPSTPATLTADEAVRPGGELKVSGNCSDGASIGSVESTIFAEGKARLKVRGPEPESFTGTAKIREDASRGRHQVELNCVGPEGDIYLDATTTVTVR
jgi:hypothetical protein